MKCDLEIFVGICIEWYDDSMSQCEVQMTYIKCVFYSIIFSKLIV